MNKISGERKKKKNGNGLTGAHRTRVQNFRNLISQKRRELLTVEVSMGFCYGTALEGR